MSKAGFIQYFKLCRFSQPTHERVLYRALQTDNVRRIVEIGVGSAERARRMIAVASRFHPPETMRYAGIDLFEARNDTPIPLKTVHSSLKSTGVTVRLVPGDATSALKRVANDLRGTDWVIISGDQEEQSVLNAWHFLPRMLHQKSKVWIESPSRDRFQILTARDVSEQLARRVKQRRAA